MKFYRKKEIFLVLWFHHPKFLAYITSPFWCEEYIKVNEFWVWTFQPNSGSLGYLEMFNFSEFLLKNYSSRSLNMSLNTSSCIYTDVFIGSHAALLEISDKLFFTELTLLWRGRYHIETICSANQWTGFYRLTASIMKELSAIKFPLAEEHLLRGLYAL